MDVRHLVVSQGRSSLVIDLKTSVKLQSVQQLLKQVALWLTLNELRQRTVELQRRANYNRS